MCRECEKRSTSLEQEYALGAQIAPSEHCVGNCFKKFHTVIDYENRVIISIWKLHYTFGHIFTKQNQFTFCILEIINMTH